MPTIRAIPLWKHAPFIRIFIPFAIGIVVAWYFSIPAYWIKLLALVPLSLSVCLSFLSLQIKYYYGFLQGINLHFLLFSVGATLVFNYKTSNHSQWIGNQPQHNVYVSGLVTEPPLKRNQSYKIIVKTNYLVHNEKLSPAQGLILLYLPADSNSARIETGDIVMFTHKFQPIRSSGNPGAFNYADYLSYSNIYFQSYQPTGSWVTVSKRTNHSFKKWLSGFQEQILLRLRRYIPNQKERGLAEALLIGYKNDLDKDLLQAYSNTGVVHVIAISGLHLGLIYWLLNLIFYPLRKNRKAKLPVSLLILAGLWLFSLLSGASPSVLRSAVMFSFIIIGNCSARKISIYNSLAASAFFLLCFNPCWLWDIGFQLSYIAVLSIVVFMKPIYHLLSVQNKLLDLLWQLSAVTFAAQILTTPLSIYHFHQFPMMFLFTNIIAVPLSSLILLAEVLLVATAGFDASSQILGASIQWMIKLMNQYIEYMNAFPYSTWNALHINLSQTILLYGFIVSAASCFQKKNIGSILFALSFLATFFAERTYSFFKASKQEILIVYNIPRKRAIDIGFGKRVHFIGDDSLLLNPGLKRNYLYPSRTQFRLVEEIQRPDNQIFVINHQKVLVINQQLSTFGHYKLPPVDIVILSHIPRFTWQELQSRVVFNQLVLDATVSPFKSRTWKADCARKDIPCHAVSVDGAFVMK